MKAFDDFNPTEQKLLGTIQFALALMVADMIRNHQQGGTLDTLEISQSTTHLIFNDCMETFIQVVEGTKRDVQDVVFACANISILMDEMADQLRTSLTDSLANFFANRKEPADEPDDLPDVFKNFIDSLDDDDPPF